MDTNQTNIEQADEIAGYLANVGILTGKTTAPIYQLSCCKSSCIDQYGCIG